MLLKTMSHYNYKGVKVQCNNTSGHKGGIYFVMKKISARCLHVDMQQVLPLKQMVQTGHMAIKMHF